MTSKTPRRGRGTLHLIASLFAISAVVRVGASSVAVAEAATEPEHSQVTEQLDQPKPSEVTVPAQDIGALLEAFQQREARLAAREAQLIDRLQALRIAEMEVTEQLAALESAEAALSETIALAEAAAETDIAQLVDVYENMKPKDAAELFEQMSPDFAAGFLAMMNPEAAAQIMTLVPPDVSYSISVVLAGRNANVPTQ